MGAASPCPYCGAPRNATADESPQQRREALRAVSTEVARIRELVERSADQSRVIAAQAREIRLLRETVARLRGAASASSPMPVRRRSGTTAA